MRPAPSLPRRRAVAGFTLAELLLASTLGAILLTSLAASLFTFTQNLSELETKAGMKDAVDPVLGVITRDIREAWRVEPVASDHIAITAPDGAVTQYFEDEGDLWVERPNGEVGVLLEAVDLVEFDCSWNGRKRDADPVEVEADWWVSSTSSPSVGLEIENDAGLALGFVAPTSDADCGLGVGAEQMLSSTAATLDLPIAWAGSGAHQLQVSLYESMGPGSAKPSGSALGTISLPGSSFPAAIADGGGWATPAVSVPINVAALGPALEPGVGYCLVFDAIGSSSFVVKQHVISSGSALADVAVQVGSGSWVVQPTALVAFSLSGPCQKTVTSDHSVVTTVSITVIPSGRPLMTRSAAILCQALSDDPWLGAVDGEAAP